MKRKKLFRVPWIFFNYFLLGVFCVAVANDNKKGSFKKYDPSKYTIEQAMSDNAQLTTIAFSGVAFLTGTLGADSFMPPGKVADFFGFQYMRDIDENSHGHSPSFLRKITANILHILDDNQKKELIELAKKQEQLYLDFGYNRYVIMDAFRKNLEMNIPVGSEGLEIENIKAYTSKLYEIDAQLSYERAEVLGGIVNSFTDEQKEYLENMKFNNSDTWPELPENKSIRRGLTKTQSVAVMTYVSELFSWYKGSLYADTYFCPERHGTYFGGFYMKDYPAMGNTDYFIDTSLTGNSGRTFLNMLTNKQKEEITEIIELQRESLNEILNIREVVSKELRKFMIGEVADEDLIYKFIKRYGELDGELSYYYATSFSKVYKTLNTAQKEKLIEIRDQNIFPEKENGYLYSTLVKLPTSINSDFLFGIGKLEDAVVEPSTVVLKNKKNKKK